jgi:hypothetical protein
MPFEQQVHADYDHARRKALWLGVIRRLTGRRNELLRFEEVRRRLRAQAQHAGRPRSVLLSAIVGSVGRYRDFDTAFLPRQTQTKGRWLSIDRAHYEGMDLPPVELYALGETYFVKDGNHRISVARERGQLFVDAVVIELRSPVPIRSLAELEEWIARDEAVAFLSATNLLELRPEAQILLSQPGHYEQLLEHISVHRWFMGIEAEHEIPYPQAVASWYDNVYLPVVEGIREASLLSEFPKRTDADLYLWLIEHLWYLREADELDDDVPLNALARSYADDFSQRLGRRLRRALRRGASAVARWSRRSHRHGSD